MGKKSEFHAVDFVRKVRDEQAAALEGKSPQEVIGFFAAAAKAAARAAKLPTRTRRAVRHG